MSSRVEYRQLGTSGLRVSVPILGAMSIGTDKWLPWVLNEDEAISILKAAWDRGVTTWDTANVYSNGYSERIIGDAIHKLGIPRHRVTILTKCGRLVLDDPSLRTIHHPHLKNERDYVNQSGLSRQAIINQVHASLERLQTDYIDLLQVHRADLENVTAEETMKALHDLVLSGKVRYIGASSMRTWQFAYYNNIADKLRLTRFVSMQSQYSLLYREDEREMNAYCDFAGIGIIPYGSLASGLLTRSVTAQKTRRSDSTKGVPFGQEWERGIVRRVEAIAQERQWTMSQVSLAWIAQKVTSPIVGFTSIQHLEEAIIPGHKLSDEEINMLEEPYQPQLVRRLQ